MLNNQLCSNSILFGQQFVDSKLVNSIKEDAFRVASSPKTAYRRLNNLKSMGLINQTRGRFNIKSGVISQPVNVLNRVMDSLIALKQARRFGKYYDKRDIRLAEENLDYRLITLDYKA